MATLTGQSIATSYEQLLHVDRDGGGNTTTLVDVKDGDNGTTFALQLASDHIEVNGKLNIDQNSNAVSLEIDTEATTASGIKFDAPAITEGNIISIDSADALTTGAAISIDSGGTALASTAAGGLVEIVHSGNTTSNVNNLLYIVNDDAGSTGTIPLYIKQDSDNHSIFIDANEALIGVGKATVKIIHGDASTMSASNIAGNSVAGGIHIDLTSDSDGAGSFIKLSSNTDVCQSAIGHIQVDENNADLAFYTDNDGTLTEAMRIDDSQNVGIGTSDPGNPLAVNRSGDGVIVDFESADAVEGTVSISGATTSYNAFVGSHYTQLKDGQNDLPVGSVVSTTGEIITCNLVVKTSEVLWAEGDDLPDGVEVGDVKEVTKTTTTNAPNKEYFTYINTTTTASDQTVYGTWMGKMSNDAKGHSFGDDDKPIYLVAQVGLFKIRVTDTNGNISIGDYLESSTRAMEGQKQTSNARVNSTIGKAMIDVDWASVETDSDLSYKWKLIPCTF